MARHEPPDHSQGDERTLGGYMAVHSRPAAFEGSDGRSYTVAIETDETGERDRPIGGYLLFVRWESVEAHMVDFRESPEFQVWRKAVGDYFAAPPTVEHVAPVVHGFGGTIGE